MQAENYCFTWCNRCKCRRRHRYFQHPRMTWIQVKQCFECALLTEMNP